MTEVLFGPTAVWFGVPAVLGTIFFTLRMAMMLLGGDMAPDADFEFDPMDVDTGEAGDSSTAFKVLSIQSIAAFMMGFGWGGIGALRGSGWPPAASVAVGLVSGLGMLWLLGVLLRFVYGLQSDGNVPMYQALETEGKVYSQIPAAGEGSGQVRVVIGDREQYYTAKSEGAAIPTGATIRVVGINDDENLVTVTEAGPSRLGPSS